jgi:hypothetical protein
LTAGDHLLLMREGWLWLFALTIISGPQLIIILLCCCCCCWKVSA